jgi:glycosyltransferase involved in cell wall biosynthesis
MTYNSPLVSIIISVRNTEQYIAETLGSLLNQTYKNFEIIIVDDASTDKTPQIIRQFNDSRINLIVNTNHSGIAACRNQAIHIAKGLFIANADADDLYHPNRLETQVNFLKNNPKISVVGTSMQYMGSPKVWHPPTQHQHIVAALMQSSSISHPSAMFKSEVFTKHNISYQPQYVYLEDYKLWQDIANANLFIANIPKVLMQYRVHHHQISNNPNIHNILQELRTQFLLQFYPNAEPDFINLHLHILNNLPTNHQDFLSWYHQIIQANQQANFINNKALLARLRLIHAKNNLQNQTQLSLREWISIQGLKRTLLILKSKNR